MRTTKDNERLMLRVSDMYYNQNYSQQEIAKYLGLSRPTISKLLTTAREKGYVKIIVTDIHGRKHYQLEQKLEDKYGLVEAVIVDTNSDEKEMKNEMGVATALFLERIIKDGDVVGVSMGTSLSVIAPHIQNTYCPNTVFFPLQGGVGTVKIELHGNYIADSLAKAFGCTYLPIHAPAVVSRLQTKEELLKESSIKKIFRKANTMRIALVGIGIPDENSTILKTGYFSKKLIEDAQKSKVCGDICINFYDANGNTDGFDYNQYVLAIDIKKLREVPYSIGVAGGLHKLNAIYGAIKGRYINTLITDYEVAKALYNL